MFLCMSFFILICFLIYHKSTRASSSSQMRALSSPATTTQSITAIDSGGNLSSLSFPSGFILIWYPPDTTLTTLAQIAKIIPSGWAICDGTQGTPDLRGRFVLMAQDTTNGTNGSIPHTINQKDGEETHVLTEAEMPSHTHTTTIPRNGGDPPSGGRSDWTVYYSQNKVSSSTGGNQPHNNMPPYYTLVYVMKL